MLTIIEAIYLVKEHRFTNPKKDLLANAALGLGFVVLSPVTKGINLVVYAFVYGHRFCDLTNKHNWRFSFLDVDAAAWFYTCYDHVYEVFECDVSILVAYRSNKQITRLV